MDSLQALAGIRPFVFKQIRAVSEKVSVDDVLQEAAIAIIKSYEKAPRTKAVWIARSARRKAWREQRRDHRYHEQNSRNVVLDSPLEALIGAEESVLGLEAFERLEGDQRRVLELRFWQGKSYQEIGEEYGVSAPTAARLVQSALQAIRKAIDE